MIDQSLHFSLALDLFLSLLLFLSLSLSRCLGASVPQYLYITPHLPFWAHTPLSSPLMPSTMSRWGLCFCRCFIIALFFFPSSMFVFVLVSNLRLLVFFSGRNFSFFRALISPPRFVRHHSWRKLNESASCTTSSHQTDGIWWTQPHAARSIHLWAMLTRLAISHGEWERKTKIGECCSLAFFRALRRKRFSLKVKWGKKTELNIAW